MRAQIGHQKTFVANGHPTLHRIGVMVLRLYDKTTFNDLICAIPIHLLKNPQIWAADALHTEFYYPFNSPDIHKTGYSVIFIAPDDIQALCIAVARYLNGEVAVIEVESFRFPYEQL